MYNSITDENLVIVLHAYHTKFGEPHHFMEIFTSLELVEAYLKNDTSVVKKEITYHEINPK